jgi:lipoyl(octanoyl) transferase
MVQETDFGRKIGKCPNFAPQSTNVQTVRYQDLGLMRYQDAWDYQTALHRQLVENKLANRHLQPLSYPQQHQLLFVEHPPVYTLGKSGHMDNLLLRPEELEARGIEYFPINRGGDITYHGPGQVVGYPILDLECFFTDVHRYVRNIEETIIKTLAEYGVNGLRIQGYTGVWVEDPHRTGGHAKICAIGVHLSRWITLHGWAFNVNTDLSYFSHIVPCGIADEDKSVTSLQALLGRPLDMGEVKERLRWHFGEVFGCLVVD